MYKENSLCCEFMEHSFSFCNWAPLVVNVLDIFFVLLLVTGYSLAVDMSDFLYLLATGHPLVVNVWDIHLLLAIGHPLDGMCGTSFYFWCLDTPRIGHVEHCFSFLSRKTPPHENQN